MNITGNAAYFLVPSTDTDVIIPARFLKRTSVEGYRPFAFYEKRYHPTTVCEPSLEKRDYVFKNTVLNEQCPLNHPNAKDATFLITWFNFGCGSSREHAVYALSNYKVIIGSAPAGKSAFADIFRDNCRQNLIWTPTLKEKDHHLLVEFVREAMTSAPVLLAFNTTSLRLSANNGALTLQTELPEPDLKFLRQALAEEVPSAAEMAKKGIEEKLSQIDSWREKNASLIQSYPNSRVS